MKKKYNFIIVSVITAIIISLFVTATQIFDSESAALTYRNSFKDYPVLTAEANITKIWSKLDSTTVWIEWKAPVYDKKNKKSTYIGNDFTIPKNQKDNLTLINTELQNNVNIEFSYYNNTFVPNPIIHYKDHTYWEKIISITIEKLKKK